MVLHPQLDNTCHPQGIGLEIQVFKCNYWVHQFPYKTKNKKYEEDYWKNLYKVMQSVTNAKMPTMTATTNCHLWIFPEGELGFGLGVGLLVAILLSLLIPDSNTPD